VGIFNIEHGRTAYVADFALYGSSVFGLSAFLMVASPRERWLEIAGFAFIGLASWPVLEYAMHRFVLHGMQPFRAWHLQHHRRPMALIATPTLLSATLIAMLVFLPTWRLGNPWCASGLTLGVLTGYLAYGVTHHAVHHWRADNAWLRRRTRWHALHHHMAPPAYFGVTTEYLDYLFGSTQTRARANSASRRRTAFDSSTILPRTRRAVHDHEDR
jgi:cyclopropane-fatty-acyl-phospholipid synthase